MRTYQIAPSILSADFARLGDEVRSVIDAGADLIHFDVMDNHYVPNLTIGPLVCRALKPHVSVPIDVHLMVTPVDALASEFAEAGAAVISFHPEASFHVDRTIGLIHQHGCKAGLAINPATPLNCLDHVLDKLDVVLIMSVNPGFAGQSFIDEALGKLTLVRARIDAMVARTGREIRLEVDGGVKVDNIGAIARAGLVAPEFKITTDTSVFGAADYLHDVIYYGAAFDPYTIVPDYSSLVGLSDSGLLDYLNLVMMANSMSPQMRATLRTALADPNFSDPNDATTRVRNLLYLIELSPEYMAQR